MEQFMQIPIDDVKAFWDAQPCNVRHSALVPGSAAFSREVRAKRYFVEPHIPLFADFQKWRGKAVLEIGCGIGPESVGFAQAGAQVTGVELSSESLAICKQSFESLGLTGRFYRVNAEELSTVLPPETYDLVYSFGVIHHAPHPERIIAEIRNYMHPQSELRIMLYAKYSWKSFMIWLGLDQPEAQYGCPIAHTYSAREVKELLNGFTVTSIVKTHIFPYRIAEYRKHQYVKVFPWSVMPGKLMDFCKSFLGWHLLITATRTTDA
jgi:SAM-dependent methyltransferase